MKSIAEFSFNPFYFFENRLAMIFIESLKTEKEKAIIFLFVGRTRRLLLIPFFPPLRNCQSDKRFGNLPSSGGCDSIRNKKFCVLRAFIL